MAEEFIYGIHTVVEALKSDTTINKLFIKRDLADKQRRQVLDLANQKKIVVSTVAKSKLDELTENQNHQGVVASIAAYQYAELDDIFELAKSKNQDPFIIILDKIEDPHNLGSILRTSDAAGVHGIIIPKRRAVQLTGTVAKTSTGAIEHVPVVRVTNISQTVDFLKERGVWIFGTDVNGQNYANWDAKGPVAIIIGNEGSGIGTALLKKVDQVLTIPMVGHVQSLNASVAASLLIYQVFNTRHK